jgi:Arc/MetJ-type ribon-helix-helix transcriptional regulator
VVVPTTQIFLDETDYWGTKKFNPWRQKAIYEYTRHDVPDTFELPEPLVRFFLQQVDKYAGASDATLQLLRYWREAVFQGAWTPETAARQALGTLRNRGGLAAEDSAALLNFAQDMHSEATRH